jgi:hypothetical protein
VVCVFCNASLVVERDAEDGTARFEPAPVAKEVVERAKQLLLEGQREAAIDLYAEALYVGEAFDLAARDARGGPTPALTAQRRSRRAEAEEAVESLFLSAYWKLTRSVPIGALGFVLYGILVSLGAIPAAWAASQAAESPWLWLVAALGGLFALWQLVRGGQHARSTWVLSFGARGRGTVRQCALVRHLPERQAHIAVVVFEVLPDDGSPAFVDRETLILSESSRPKLEVGRTVRVRFSRDRTLVFPEVPVTVV